MAKKIRFKTPFNSVDFPTKGEKFTLPSKTVPDQSLSVSEIMSRYAKGMPLDVPVSEPIFHGEDEFYPDPRSLDLVDRHEMSERVTEEVNTLKEKIAERKKNKFKSQPLPFKKEEVENPDADKKPDGEKPIS